MIPSRTTHGEGERSARTVVRLLKARRLFRSQPFIILLVIIFLSIVIPFFNPVFLTIRNFQTVLQQSSVTGIASLCMVLLMVSGGLDFSIGSVISLTCVIVAKLVEREMSTVTAVLIGLSVATACGAVNGLIIAKSKCPPIIITLGMLYVYYGIALNIAQGRFLNLFGRFELLGSSTVLFVPFPIVVWIVMVVLLIVLLRYTKFGRRLYAMGSNEEAAFLAGISVDLNKVIAYTLNGLIAGIAAVVLISRLGSVIANVGADYALRALSAAVIGGVSFEGGRGTVIGAVLGVILLGIVYNAMNILGITAYFQNIVLGIIVVSAVVFSNLGKLKR
ncbi:MAG: ABC transporter permease [Spirochaetaceae bacterium]|nr:MAG: ABC transporter permease [Spirochaetaceae bacterium]